MIVYKLGDSGEELVFAPNVLRHFQRYQQRRWWSREAGGPMFVSSEGFRHTVVVAAGPFPLDHRTRHGLTPHRPTMQACINSQRALGHHYIGSWHSHPESTPRPSHIDLRTMESLFSGSTHQLHAFVCVIVGAGSLLSALHVGAWTKDGYVALKPKKSG